MKDWGIPSDFKIDPGSIIPLHMQVENLLRELIQQSEYLEGKFLPKEVELSKFLGVSRNTVRQATNKLVLENRLVRRRGVGTKVVKQSVTTKLDNWVSFSQEMYEKGVSFENHKISTEWVLAGTEVGEKLEVADTRKVLKLSRLRGVGKGPVVYFISYFHPRIGLTGEEDFSRHLYEILETEYATVATVSKEEIRAIVADKDIAKQLKIKKGDPVLFRKRVVCDPGGRPVEFNLGFYRADSFTYSIEITRS